MLVVLCYLGASIIGELFMKSINYKLGCLLVGVFCATSALADEFADRVVQANQAIQTPDGAHYDQLLMPHIAPVIKACVAKI